MELMKNVVLLSCVSCRKYIHSVLWQLAECIYSLAVYKLWQFFFLRDRYMDFDDKGVLLRHPT